MGKKIIQVGLEPMTSRLVFDFPNFASQVFNFLQKQQYYQPVSFKEIFS